MTTDLGVSDVLSALSKGISMSLGDPELRGRIAVSLAINAVAFLVLAGALLWGAFALIDWALGGAEVADAAWYLEVWYWIRSGMRWLLYIVMVVGALFYSPVIFTILASALLPAFHGPVFAGARTRAGGQPVAAGEVGVVRTISIEVVRLVRFIGLSIALLPLNLVPGIGSVAYLVAQFYLSASTLGWDLMAYHFELHGMDMRAQEAFVKDRRSMVLTLGAGATLLAMVPVAQLLFITTNVAGAGVLSAWLDGGPRTGV